jgi:hypothetical protein
MARQQHGAIPFQETDASWMKNGFGSGLFICPAPVMATDPAAYTAESANHSSSNYLALMELLPQFPRAHSGAPPANTAQ